MTSPRKLVSVPLLVVVAVAVALVPATRDVLREPYRPPECAFSHVSALPEAERAAAVRSATRAFSVLGSTDRRADPADLATGGLLAKLVSPAPNPRRLPFMRGKGDTERVSEVTAVGITARCGASARHGGAGRLTMMAVGRVKITGAPAENRAPHGVQVQYYPPRPGPGETIERVARWTLWVDRTPAGWRVSEVFDHPSAEELAYTLSGRAEAKGGPATQEQFLSLQVSTAAEEVFDHRHGDPDALARAVDRHLTGDAVRQHQALFAPVAARAEARGADVETSLESLGIVRHTTASATLVVFLNQEAGRSRDGRFRPNAIGEGDGGVLGPPGSGTLAYEITALRTGGRWRISGFRSLA